MVRVRGKGGKVVLVPLPPAVSRAGDRSAADRTSGTLLLHRHLLRHTFVNTMLDAGVDLRDVQIAARYADPRSRRVLSVTQPASEQALPVIAPGRVQAPRAAPLGQSRSCARWLRQFRVPG